MNNKEEIIGFLSFYQEISESVPYSSNESFVLQLIKEDFEWRDLPNEQKQLKRVSVLKKVKYVLSEDNQHEFDLEESIVDLYQAVQNMIDDLELLAQKIDTDYNLIRFKAMLVAQKILLNESYDAKRIRHFNYTAFKNVIRDFVDSGFFDKSYKHLGLKIVYLESKLNDFYRIANSPA